MLNPRGRERRRVLQALGGAVAAVFVAGFRSLADRLSAVTADARRVVIPAEAGGDVVFADDVVVCRGPERVAAFRARCSHLGCRISSQVDGALVCPCHGSRFHPDGSVAAGPAIRPLESLRSSTDEAGNITVEL